MCSFKLLRLKPVPVACMSPCPFAGSSLHSVNIYCVHHRRQKDETGLCLEALAPTLVRQRSGTVMSCLRHKKSSLRSVRRTGQEPKAGCASGYLGAGKSCQGEDFSVGDGTQSDGWPSKESVGGGVPKGRDS